MKATTVIAWFVVRQVFGKYAEGYLFDTIFLVIWESRKSFTRRQHIFEHIYIFYYFTNDHPLAYCLQGNLLQYFYIDEFYMWNNRNALRFHQHSIKLNPPLCVTTQPISVAAFLISRISTNSIELISHWIDRGRRTLSIHCLVLS